MPAKYHHRRVTPAEFTGLMRRAGMKMNDFLFLTGRHVEAVSKFLSSERNAPFTPTMGDVMILEMAARDPDALDKMTEIANEYSAGPRPEEEQARRNIANPEWRKPS